MKHSKIKNRFILCLIFVLFASMSGLFAQPIVPNKMLTIKKNGFTLQFTCKSTEFSQETSQKLIDTFFKVYPPMVNAYNKKSPKLVTFVVDPEYDGVAATSNDKVVFSVKYMTAHPGDIDVVTHEVMHIIQAYGNRSGMPGWVTEGIADYVRHLHGVSNASANWSLPPFSEKHRYQSSYRITARFFAWLEQSGYKGIVKKLDKAGRDKTYNDGAIWKELTGKTVDELWSDYTKNPAIS